MSKPIVGVTVRVKIRGLYKFAKMLTPPVAQPFRDMYVHWGERMRGFWRERFAQESRGGGEWPDLADSTKRQRRGPSKQNKKKGGPRKFAILRNLGLLFNALDTVFRGAPGALQEDLPKGIKVGFGGPARHPAEGGTTKGALATIADIAGFHQTGGPHLPQRRIIVGPTDRVLQLMAQDGDRAMRRAIKDSGSDTGTASQE